MTEDFYRLLMETPEAERVGKVFKLDGLRTRAPITTQKVCCLLSKIGKKAGVVVATKEKRRRVDGKLIPVTVKKFASATICAGALAPDGPSGSCRRCCNG